MAINQVESKSEEQKKQQVRIRRPVSGLKKSFQTKPRTPSTKKSNKKNSTQAWTKPNQKPPSNLKKYLIKFISYLKTKKLDSSLTQLTFKIGEHEIEESTDEKLLGVWVSNELNWSEHIENAK